jgi:hypothetical protein
MPKKKVNDPDGVKINPDGSKSFRVKGKINIDAYEKHWGVTVRRTGDLSATDKIFKENMNKPRPIKGGSAFSDFYKQGAKIKPSGGGGVGRGGARVEGRIGGAGGGEGGILGRKKGVR